MCSSPRFIYTQMWNCLVCQPPPCLSWSASQCLSCPVLQPHTYSVTSPPLWPVSAPPTGLNEYFFFNFLVVGLPYSLIFLAVLVIFFFLNLLLSFFSLHEDAKCIYLHLHLGWKSLGVLFDSSVYSPLLSSVLLLTYILFLHIS